MFCFVFLEQETAYEIFACVVCSERCIQARCVCVCVCVRVCGCAGVRVCGCAGVRVCGYDVGLGPRRGFDTIVSPRSREQSSCSRR